ncbi:MAG: HAD family phosphatase [Endomicrobium sp.]|jgi:putative hydrolase of the HAD superfamily|nr:HAD family phosphatase [Endomicrobium sp.]
MSIKIIVFDIGHVIIRFDLSKFIKACLKKIPEHKVSNFNDLFPVYSDIAYSYEKGNISSLDFYNIIAKKTEYRGTYSEFSTIWNGIFELIPGTIEIVTALAQNYQLAVFSNTNELHFNYLKDRYADVFGLFSKFFLSHEMHLRKPENEIFKQLIQNYGILPSQIFYTDDVEENIRVAKRNGISAHLFTSPLELIKQLRNQKVKI